MVLGQDCPARGDKPTALRFLLTNKPHAVDADPKCVELAFYTLSKDATYAADLIGLLDFERSVEHDDFRTTEGRYPAMGALIVIGKPAVPYLIEGVKDQQQQGGSHQRGPCPCYDSQAVRARGNGETEYRSQQAGHNGRATVKAGGGQRLYWEFLSPLRV
jgi:hypothetical protein